jgi:ribonucleoside-diphosphate reductase alpha chain
MRINYSRDSLISEQGMKLLRDYYMKSEDKSPQDALARTARFFASDAKHAQRIYDAVSKQYFMFSSPILSNSNEGKGLPISCFLSYVPDTIEGLIEHESETEWLSIFGGGVGGHWDAVRSVDKKSPGPIPFMHSIDGSMTAYKQGETRKGAYAAYLGTSHPSINEFLQVRVPTGGDINRKCMNIHNAVNMTDDFMEAVKYDQSWDLLCPKKNTTVKTERARDIWESSLTTRHRTGEPYMNFIDTANKYLHPAQKALGLKIHGSNLCNEIHLVTNEERTAVCCLSSLNLELYDEWKDIGLVADLVEFLDNVLDHFIAKAPDVIAKARYAAMRSRDIGIGAMGWHGMLMKRSIPFESDAALALTESVFSDINRQGKDASLALAYLRGACPDARETGYPDRNLHIFAIAPNANSSILCNATPSIEPISSNAYAHRTRAGTHLVVNPILMDVLRTKAPHTTLSMLGMTVDQWVDKQLEIVVRDDGSVRKLDCLNDHEKAVFKTFKEINMEAVVMQAGVRQRWLCQGQSVNLHFPAECEKSYFNHIHLLAHEQGLKGLYYVRTGSVGKTDKVSDEILREALGDSEECTACHS